MDEKTDKNAGQMDRILTHKKHQIQTILTNIGFLKEGVFID